MKLIDLLLEKITNRLPCRILKDGDTPYRECYYLFTLIGFTFYLHKLVGNDPDIDLYDHPWRKSYTLILSGWYWEETRCGTRKIKWFNSLTGDTFHRVVLNNKRKERIVWEQGHRRFSGEYDFVQMPCWTLFFHTSENIKPCGFFRVERCQYGMPRPTDRAIFEPCKHTCEGSQKDWWLTAKTGYEFRINK